MKENYNPFGFKNIDEETKSSSLLILLGDYPDRIKETIQLYEKSSMFETSKLLKNFCTFSFLKIAKFLVTVYTLHLPISFSSSVAVTSSPVVNSPDSIPKQQITPTTSESKDNIFIGDLTRSEIATLINQCWTSGFETFHLLDQIKIVSTMVTLLTRLKYMRKSIFYLRQLYLLLGSFYNNKDVDPGQNTDITSLLEIMKKVSNLISLVHHQTWHTNFQ